MQAFLICEHLPKGHISASAFHRVIAVRGAIAGKLDRDAGKTIHLAAEQRLIKIALTPCHLLLFASFFWWS